MKNIVRVSTIAATFSVATIIPNGMQYFSLGVVIYILFATVTLKKAPQKESLEEVRLSHH